MADNTQLNTMTGGDTIATKDIAGVKHQESIVEARSSGYFPQNTTMNDGEGTISGTTLAIDPDRSLITRGGVTTDEGSYSTSFPGNTFPKGPFERDATLVTGTGQTITVNNDSKCSIVAGTTTGAEAYYQMEIDYLPLHIEGRINLSQRIANQDIYFELGNGTTPANDTQFTRYHWTGTDNTKVRCETQSSTDTGGNEGIGVDLIQASTATNLIYHIELTPDGVLFEYGDSTGAETELVRYWNEFPDIYTSLYLRLRVKNGTSPVSSTTITNDWLRINNVDQLAVGSEFKGNPISVKVETFDDPVAITDGTHNLTINADGSLNATQQSGTSFTVAQGTGTNLHAVLDSGTVTTITNVVHVDDNSSTLTVDQGTSSNLKNEPNGNIAHDGADSGNPIKMGARAVNALPTVVSANNDRSDLISDFYGQQFIRTDHINSWSYLGTGVLTGATVKGAPGSGLKIYVTSITFSIGAATASSVKLTINAGADIFGPHYLEAINGRGLCMVFPSPIPVTANTALLVTTTGSATQTVNVFGFVAP